MFGFSVKDKAKLGLSSSDPIMTEDERIECLNPNNHPFVMKSKSRCRKCIYETQCSRDKDHFGTCPNYKRDAPDGGYYG